VLNSRILFVDTWKKRGYNVGSERAVGFAPSERIFVK